MSKIYLITFKQDMKIHNQIISTFSSRKEKIDYMDSVNSILKSQIKNKLNNLKDLDPKLEIVNDTFIFVPTLVISCNDKMIAELQKDPDLLITENQQHELIKCKSKRNSSFMEKYLNFSSVAKAVGKFFSKQIG